MATLPLYKINSDGSLTIRNDIYKEFAHIRNTATDLRKYVIDATNWLYTRLGINFNVSEYPTTGLTAVNKSYENIRIGWTGTYRARVDIEGTTEIRLYASEMLVPSWCSTHKTTKGYTFFSLFLGSTAGGNGGQSCNYFSGSSIFVNTFPAIMNSPEYTTAKHEVAQACYSDEFDRECENLLNNIRMNVNSECNKLLDEHKEHITLLDHSIATATKVLADLNLKKQTLLDSIHLLAKNSVNIDIPTPPLWVTSRAYDSIIAYYPTIDPAQRFITNVKVPTIDTSTIEALVEKYNAIPEYSI